MLALVFFLFNLVLYMIFLGMTVVRFMMFPNAGIKFTRPFCFIEVGVPDLGYDVLYLWVKSSRHPVQGLSVGTFSIATSNIIEGALFLNRGFAFGGKGFLHTMWGFWWANVGIAMLITFGMLYIM